MNNQNIACILKMHSVPFFEKDGHIYADSMISDVSLFEEIEDMTGKSKKEIYEWLGY